MKCWSLSVIAVFCVADFAVVAQTIASAYLPDYHPTNVPINQTVSFITDLILFSPSPHESGLVEIRSDCCVQQRHLEIARQARSYKQQLHVHLQPSSFLSNDHLNIWITIGGGGRSDSFSQFAADSTLRTRFIQSIVSFW